MNGISKPASNIAYIQSRSQARRGKVAIVSSYMRSGHGMNAAVRRHLQHGVAVLVDDEHVARVVGHGEVRAGKVGIRGESAFEAGPPGIRPVKADLALPGDGFQDTVGMRRLVKPAGVGERSAASRR